jgi:hypothetical protein
MACTTKQVKFDILTVNHVGGHPKSPNDLWRRQIVFDDLFDNHSVDWNDVQHNWIDLPEHDFLRVQPKADVTILHFIPDEYLGRVNCVGLFNVSMLHSIDSWRKAICNSEAKYVYVFGDMDEISGKKLKELPGYKRELFLDSYKRFGIELYVYVKES